MPDDRNVPMPATQAPAATAPASRPAFDIGDLDTGSGACTNLDTFVNAKWAKANPIPPDKTSWGVFDELLEKSLATQRQIIEAAAKQADKQADPLTRKLGLLYASGMDETAIEAAGDQPIRPQLEAIAALDSSTAIADYITKRYAEGDALVFEFGAGPDFHKAEQQIGFGGEGGLGLPTKDYYTAAQYAPIRAAYLAYIAKSFELTGSDADTAKRQAKDVMALESRLAAASLAPTDARQPKNQYHFLSVADADKITPHFS